MFLFLCYKTAIFIATHLKNNVNGYRVHVCVCVCVCPYFLCMPDVT
jgi:hypothetical protein